MHWFGSNQYPCKYCAEHIANFLGLPNALCSHRGFDLRYIFFSNRDTINHRRQKWFNGTIKSPHARESKTVLDSGFRAVEIGFPILIVRSMIFDSLSCIPDSKAQDSGILKENVPSFRIPQAKISRIAESGFPYNSLEFHSISDDGCNITSLKCHKSPAPKPWGARGRETSRVRGWRRMKFQTSNIPTIDQKRHTDILDEMKELPKPRKIIMCKLLLVNPAGAVRHSRRKVLFSAWVKNMALSPPDFFSKEREGVCTQATPLNNG